MFFERNAADLEFPTFILCKPSTFVYKSKKSDEEEHGVPKTQMVLFLVKTYKKLGSDWNIHL